MDSSSRSKAEYRISGGRSPLLKKANGCQTLLTNCSKTAHTAVPDASVVKARGACLHVWCNRVASDKSLRELSKARDDSGVQVIILDR